jgi:hypothetical protein
MRRSLLVLLLVAVLAIGFLIYRGGRPSLTGEQRPEVGQAPPTTVASAPPTTVPAPAPPVAPTATRPAPTAVLTPTPASRDVVMEVTEGDLQSELTTMLVGKSLGTTPLGDATIQTVSVTLRDHQVLVGGDARAGFLNAPFTAAGTLAPDASGRPKVSVREATVGGVGLPDGTRAALADLLQTQVDEMFANQSMKVRTIDIADGKMRVVGTQGS